MCGIVGIVNNNGLIDINILEQMTNALNHRGPDDDGVFISQKNGKAVGLGHRRLSIIDISKSGQQPMSNEDQTVHIVFNGEIYNFKELKKDLIDKGHIFKSNTDTEVIIHGYEEYGDQICKKLNGMFAFGLWDENQQLLILARDRYGQKPLYYFQSKEEILFASELKSLIKYPGFINEINYQSLSLYLLYEYIPAPDSIYKNVKKLSPGNLLVWQNGNIKIKSYWDIKFNNKKIALTIPEIEKKILELLKKSIEIRMMSDVPLGVFLSGGIDSSAIVALMSELISGKNIKTFSIGFNEKSFDESFYSREVAKTFGTDHHEQILTPGIMLDILPEIISFLDEPFADASIIPTYLLSKFTRNYVTVALGGDGGDELFAGYDPFIAHVFASYYEKIPKFIHNKILKISNNLPVSTNNMSFDFKLKQFLKGIPYRSEIRNQVWLGAFSAKEQYDIFNPDIRQLLIDFNPYESILSSINKKEFRDNIDKIIFLYSKFYLAEDILTKVDRASMAVSLEVRSPFLDVNLAEFVNSIPSKLKLKGICPKFILKKSLKSKLNRDILYRNKKGFGIPLAKWMKNDLKPILLDIFSPSKIKKQGIFNEQAIKNILEKHFQGKQDCRKQIWTLLMFQMWEKKYG